jgi:hypothetical protein
MGRRCTEISIRAPARQETGPPETTETTATSKVSAFPNSALADANLVGHFHDQFLVACSS